MKMLSMNLHAEQILVSVVFDFLDYTIWKE